ncbi:MAG: acetylxylan esterase [Pirellulaceae bacterium]
MSIRRRFDFALSRRACLRQLGGLSLGAGAFVAGGPRLLLGQEAGVAKLAPLNGFPRMVQEHFVAQVRAAEERSVRKKLALQTKADAQAYVRDVQAKIRECFGPEPESTPLNPRITGVVDRDAYKIEKVIFESRPEFFVTGNLYVPKHRKLPLPGVIGVCGHSANGKAAQPYQSFAQGLARQGYVVFMIDPIGQGERLQYTDDKLQPRQGIGVSEHLLAGNQQFLVGEFLGAWRAWDAVRALDYLLGRDEVDPKHIGITGNSGGGTLTTWLCGVESRWTMAAPACFVTTFRRNLENELPADTEQCPPRAIALGLDHDDFLAAMAPKPVIILAKERDFFDVRGAEEAFERLQRLYALLEAPDNIRLFVGPTNHGYSQENREAMYQWFNRATGISDEQTEPKLTIESDETLQCTPQGQVAGLKSRTVFSFTAEKSQALAAARPAHDGQELRTSLAAALQLSKLPQLSDGPPNYRILRPARARKYPRRFSTTYAVESEPGVFALVARLADEAHLSRPPQTPAPAILYVSHHSADAEMRDEPLVKELLEAAPEAVFYACDVRGIGHSRPDTCGSDQFLLPYGSDYFYAVHSLMLDRPYVGQKTWDVLRVLEWLAAAGHRTVHLAGKGWGALPATFAAVLSPRVSQVTLKHALISYADLAETEVYRWPLSAMLPDGLRTLDLPDCYRELERSKRLRQIEARSAGESV